MAQLPLKQGSWAIYVPKNNIFFAIFCAGFSPFFFLNIKLLFWDIDGATPGVCAIYVGIPSLILAKWRKLSWASKGRDALKPNFNKWPEEPFLPSRNGSSGHLLKFGFKASRPLLAKWRKLRHRCPKKGHRWRNSFSRYCNAIVIFFNIFLSKYVEKWDFYHFYP